MSAASCWGTHGTVFEPWGVDVWNCPVFVLTVEKMSQSHAICRNPRCRARFSRYNRILSRPVPALVDTAALDAYYAANPDKAVHRSPDRVCSHCGRQEFVKPPTWLPQYLRVYASMTCGCSPSPRLSPPLFSLVFLRRVESMP